MERREETANVMDVGTEKGKARIVEESCSDFTMVLQKVLVNLPCPPELPYDN